MPTIDLNEKRDLLVRREDIIATIRTSITDGEILEDIIESVERQVVARCAELGRVSIPYFGAFVPNEGKLDAIEHQHVMKVHRDTMSREEYMEFKKNLLRERFKVRRGFRSRTIIINRTIRLNRNHADRILKRFRSDRWFRLYFYLYAYMGAHDTLDYYASQIVEL